MSFLVALAALLSVAVLVAAPAPAHAITIVVNSDGDEDDATGSDAVCDINLASPPGTEVCTLRAAMQTANDTPGPDMITFDIPLVAPNTRADGVRVIQVGDATGFDLPELTDVDRTTIDGRTQGTGANNAPQILIIPSTTNPPPSVSGLATIGGTFTVTGVAIGGFEAGIVLGLTNGVTIEGTFLGIDPDGSTAIPNDLGVGVFASDNTTIGGSLPASRNVISNNTLDGISLENVGFCGCGTQSTKIQGNYIGLNAAGTLARPNQGSGIFISDSVEVTVGGAAPGEANVISGNGENGIAIDGFDNESNRIYGNRIGTNATGTAAIGNDLNGIAVVDAFDTRIGDGTASGPGNLIVGNGEHGIFVLGAGLTTIRGNRIGLLPNGTAAPNKSGIYANAVVETDIGGTTDADRNIISGNTNEGIALEAVCGCGPNTVRGNYIGLNDLGTAAAPNGGSGIRVYEELLPIAASELVIGGLGPGAGNVISGNGEDGVTILGLGARAVELYGNRIGTNAAGTAAVPNARDGIALLPIDPTVPPFFFDQGPTQTLIGSDGPGSGNVISGNARHGINMLKVQPSPEGGTVVSRNLIGVNASGTGPLPNGGVGVLVRESTLLAVTANTIASNGLGGVVQTRAAGVFDGMFLAANRIFDNQGLGIDLAEALQPNGAGDGVTANALGRPENFPVLATATTSGVGTTVAGTLTGVPANQAYRIELFASPTCDPSGNGEGASFLGGINVQSNGAGNASFSAMAASVPANQFLTATSTNANGQTSEFSACTSVAAAGIVVTPTSGLTTTETGGTATFTVKLATLPLADVTIELASSRPTEATVSPASLTFTPANGTTEQTVTVTGVADTTTDGNQAFTIFTAPATSTDLTYSGLDAADVTGQNVDSPIPPTVSIQGAAPVTEGTGTDVPISFPVTLSAASAQPVTVNWEVVDGTARAATDIVPTDWTGILSFAPGETSKPIVLRVVGDAEVEGTETFSVTISNAQNAVLGTATASGSIVDDDQPSTQTPTPTPTQTPTPTPPTQTSTPTPTQTPVPTPCAPRPAVAIVTSRIGPDRVLVSVTAGFGAITRITFGSPAQPMRNAVIEGIGPGGEITGFGTFTPPGGVPQQSFVIRRPAPGQPYFVTLTVEDGCGPWPTFVGAGPGAS